MECPVCYNCKATCTLVCNHAFCKECVKAWYYKCDEPSCPMCRRSLYFKGMHKVAQEWDKERSIQKNEDVFNQVFDDIFEEDSEFGSDTESEAGSDSNSWETASHENENENDSEPEREYTNRDYYSEYILGEIVLLQKAYQKAEELGLDFEWYYHNSWFFDIEPSRTVYIEDDVFPHFKNLFVSNHKHRGLRDSIRKYNTP